MKKNKKNFVCALIAASMLFTNVYVSPVIAADNTVDASIVALAASGTFDPTTLTAAADKELLTAAELTAPFGVDGIVEKRVTWADDAMTQISGVGSVQVYKANGSAVTVTVDGPTTIEATMCSTGRSNTSVIGIAKADGTIITQDTVTGTEAGAVTITANVTEAGIYRVMTLEDSTRGAKILRIVVGNVAETTTTETTTVVTTETTTETTTAVTTETENNKEIYIDSADLYVDYPGGLSNGTYLGGGLSIVLGSTASDLTFTEGWNNTFSDGQVVSVRFQIGKGNANVPQNQAVGTSVGTNLEKALKIEAADSSTVTLYADAGSSGYAGGDAYLLDSEGVIIDLIPISPNKSYIPQIINIPAAGTYYYVIPNKDTSINIGGFRVAFGEKTQETVEISNADELFAFANRVNNGETALNAILTANITINDGTITAESTSADQWTPIGTQAKPYVGSFDGQGYTISGLYANNSAISYVGLFGATAADCVIKNINVENSYFCGSDYVGAICGINSGSITKCRSTAALSGNACVGGICGVNDGNISYCYNKVGQVNADDFNVGGICGENTGSINKCYNTASVIISSNGSICGSICGSNYGEITSCYYQNGSATDGIGDGTGDVAEKTEKQFASGEVCYLLNDKKTEDVIFYQAIGKDSVPNFKRISGIVYCAGTTYFNYYIKGDLNGDNIVDNTDAAVVLKYLSGIIVENNFTNEYNTTEADYNGDGIVDIQDAIAILGAAKIAA